MTLKERHALAARIRLGESSNDPETESYGRPRWMHLDPTGGVFLALNHPIIDANHDWEDGSCAWEAILTSTWAQFEVKVLEYLER